MAIANAIFNAIAGNLAGTLDGLPPPFGGGGGGGGPASWDISGADLSLRDSTLSGINSYQSSLWGVGMKTDGTRVFFSGDSGSTIVSADLSTAWDLSTADLPGYSTTGALYSAGAGRDMWISNDGTILLFARSNGSIGRWVMSTPWDVTSIGGVNSFSTGFGTVNCSPAFNSDGTKLWILNQSTDVIHQYTCSSPYAPSTAVADSITFDLGTALGTTNIPSWFPNPNDTQFFVRYNDGTTKLCEFNFTEGDISTAVQGAVTAISQSGFNGLWMDSSHIVTGIGGATDVIYLHDYLAA